MKEITLKITETEEGVKLTPTGLEKNDEVYGENVLNVLETFLNELKIREKETEEERLREFLKLNKEIVHKTATEFYTILGVEYLTIDKICSRLKKTKEEVTEIIDLLYAYGYIQVDRQSGAGKRYRVELSTEALKQHYFNESEKYKATAKYYEELYNNIEKAVE